MNMAKTPTKDDQPFIYQLGKDIVRLGLDIEKLKNKSVKAVRIVVPAKQKKYQQYGLKAVINLPPECQNAICIKSKNGEVSLVETEETLSVYAGYNVSEFYLAPIYRLEADTITAVLDQQQINDIDDAQEREERERKERQEREERERKERQEREERDKHIYKYLAKWLTDNYLESVRAKAGTTRDYELMGIKVYVNKNGLKALLDKPFERNSNMPTLAIDESTYADAKEAMLTEKARIDRGEVDLSIASDFNVVDYRYIDDML